MTRFFLITLCALFTFSLTACEVSDDDDDSAVDDSDYALSFSGDEHPEATLETPLCALGREFTLEWWYNANDPVGTLFDCRDRLQRGVGWHLYLDNDGMLMLELGEVEGYFQAPSNIVPGAFEGWHHVAVVRDENGMYSWYWDGQLENSVVGPAPVGAPAPFTVGHETHNSPDALRGMVLDEIRLSSTARYVTSFAPPARPEVDEDTDLLFHFDEGEGLVTRDEVHDLILYLHSAEWVSL